MIKANGNENTSTLLHLSVNEIKKFDVGKEKPKVLGYSEPKDEELIPLRLLGITSDNKKVQEKTKKYKLKMTEIMKVTNKLKMIEILAAVMVIYWQMMKMIKMVTIF